MTPPPDENPAGGRGEPNSQSSGNDEDNLTPPSEEIQCIKCKLWVDPAAIIGTNHERAVPWRFPVCRKCGEEAARDTFPDEFGETWEQRKGESHE